ncbi:hypothetical protein SPSPH_038120 [Sporomusa sphaeroides DSM 2875]|uniref:Transposase n=1 Tax=Sporomusa sphaeroides DSM 2875 TaxID=1337886 RepID=A0ABP2CA88_9FIRM|nr:hypothetical protein SPSPH_44240 [Sporomusa sphaeroides DSM 2875]CVK20837.1 hypothetical protein SSPH_03505 [Sporomusa sphaeroides DSM 2875]
MAVERMFQAVETHCGKPMRVVRRCTEHTRQESYYTYCQGRSLDLRIQQLCA